MTEAEKAYQYFVIAVPENEEQAKAYFYARKALQPTLTPLNECVSRLRELDELYTKLHAVTGFTAEQLLEMFAAGYTLEKKVELEQVKRERDAAIDCIYKIMDNEDILG